MVLTLIWHSVTTSRWRPRVWQRWLDLELYKENPKQSSGIREFQPHTKVDGKRIPDGDPMAGISPQWFPEPQSNIIKEKINIPTKSPTIATPTIAAAVATPTG